VASPAALSRAALSGAAAAASFDLVKPEPLSQLPAIAGTWVKVRFRCFLIWVAAGCMWFFVGFYCPWIERGGGACECCPHIKSEKLKPPNPQTRPPSGHRSIRQHGADPQCYANERTAENCGQVGAVAGSGLGLELGWGGAAVQQRLSLLGLQTQAAAAPSKHSWTHTISPPALPPQLHAGCCVA